MDRRKGRVPTPREINQLARAVTASLESITTGKFSFAEAHTHVHSDRRDPVRSDENQGLRISNSHVSNPTAEIVESQAWNRERLAQVGRILEGVARDVDTAVARLRDVFSSPDDYFNQLESYRP